MVDSGVGEVNPSYDTDTEPLVLGEEVKDDGLIDKEKYLLGDY